MEKGILIPDQRIAVVSSLQSPYMNIGLLKVFLERLVIDQIQSIIWLGDMVESEAGFRKLRQVFELSSKAVDCQYWISGSLENSLGSTYLLVSQMGIERLVHQGKLILPDSSCVEAFGGKWLIIYEKTRNNHLLSKAELLARAYQKNVLVANRQWAIGRIEGEKFIIDSGSMSNKPDCSSMYWYLLDGVPQANYE